MLSGIADPADPALRRALAVHRNTSHKAAQDALAANFPVVARLVGPDAFLACASAFIERLPPADPRLCLYGDGFAAHVAEWCPYSQYPYLGPVAALERLVVEALFAADAVPLDPGAVAAGPDPDMALALHPAARIANFNCPAASLWRAHQSGSDEDLENVTWQPETVLITRPRLAVELQVVDDATHAFLAAPTLGAAAAAAHDSGGDVAAIFASLLISGAFA